MNKSYKGFALCSDIEDEELRVRNQGVIMANIAEQYLDKRSKKISLRGAGLIFGYFNAIPKEFRKKVEEKFTSIMKERNFVIAN